MTAAVVAATGLTADEARQLTDDIRHDLDGLLPKIKRAYDGRADQALGYSSWLAYCGAELNNVRIPIDNRPAMVQELHRAGMSQRAIAGAIGVSAATVNSDLSTVQDRTVGPERIVSLDGRSRPARTQTLGPAEADAAPSAGPGPTMDPERHLKAVPDEAPTPPSAQGAELAADLARESERRTAVASIRSVLTYLTSRVLEPAEVAQQYAIALDNFTAEDLRFASRTLAALADLKEQ